ncbi:hypothetical protein E9Q_03623 [Moraxella catarrhalis BC1]|nr:hypothetical protein E9Q_03623 [Moraxella catarrhalis BC1]
MPDSIDETQAKSSAISQTRWLKIYDNQPRKLQSRRDV